MLGQEIRKKINENNTAIEKLMNPGKFVLNKEILTLLNENRSLQKLCSHVFEKGKCIYCDKEE